MNPLELRASIALASIYALRMLGLFLILPVFAIHASALPGGNNATLVGFAFGVYGLVQAFLYIPLGRLSDRIGRKPVIYAGLICMIIGSFVAASHDDLIWITVGRALQGAGAISAALTALLADLTREEHRSKGMAMVGGSIALTFAISLVAAPPLYRAIGLTGMFTLMGVLATLALAIVLWVVPKPDHAAQASPTPFMQVLRNPHLLRLDVGVLALHAAQAAMFMVVPSMLRDAGIPLESHWEVYLPVVLLSFVFLVPPVIAAEKGGKMRPVLLACVGLMLIVQIGLAGLAQSTTATQWTIGLALLGFFSAFNILEALQPSLVSRFSEKAKGTAMGVYNTTQTAGLFLGSAGGGYLLKYAGRSAVFTGCAILMLVWLIIAWKMQAPPARTQPKTDPQTASA